MSHKSTKNAMKRKMSQGIYGVDRVLEIIQALHNKFSERHGDYAGMLVLIAKSLITTQQMMEKFWIEAWGSLPSNYDHYRGQTTRKNEHRTVQLPEEMEEAAEKYQSAITKTPQEYKALGGSFWIQLALECARRDLTVDDLVTEYVGPAPTKQVQVTPDITEVLAALKQLAN